MNSQSDTDPVSLLLKEVKKTPARFGTDRMDRPVVWLKGNQGQQEYRLRDDNGKPTERARVCLRSLYHIATEGKRHLSNADLDLTLDYLAEEAFQGPSTVLRADTRHEDDYNFEAVIVLAATLTKDSPGIIYDANRRTLTYKLKTADLWKAINDPKIEVQVMADKKTLCKAINFFSRRLREFREEFWKEGLELTVTHKEKGSWVTIVRHDDVCPPGPVLIVPDDDSSSSSGSSSGQNPNNRNALERTEATDIETEQPKKGDDR